MAFSTDNRSENDEYQEFLRKYAQGSKAEAKKTTGANDSQSKEPPSGSKSTQDSSNNRANDGAVTSQNNQNSQATSGAKSSQSEQNSKGLPGATEKNSSQAKPRKVSFKLIAAVLGIVFVACIGILLYNNSHRATSNIVFSKNQYELTVGQSEELHAEVLPANAKNQEYTFVVSDNDIIDIKGSRVTAKNAGTSIVSIVQDGIQYGQCVVKVNDIEPTSISVLSDEPYMGFIGRPFELPVVYKPANTTDKHLLITIEDPKIAEVRDGKIVGLKRGSTEVSVLHQSTSLATSFSIHFEPVELESIRIDMPKSVRIGDSIPLVCIFNPGDATDQTIKWTSSSSCAVIEDGKLVARREGETTLRAYHSSSIQDSIQVLVSEVPVESVKIKLYNSDIVAGDSKTLEVSFTPSNATNTKVSWSSSNPSVAKVDKYGKVTGVSAGTAVITCQSANGMKDTAVVKVSPRPLEIVNGWVLKPSNRCCPMTVNAPKGESVYVYFKEATNPKLDFAVLVKAGSSYEFEAPLGTYTVYYASGTKWYGKDYKFGENTDYVKCDSVLRNYIEGNYYVGHELTLYKVANGNMSSTDISANQFPG